MTDGSGLDPERLAFAQALGIDPSEIADLTDEQFAQVQAQQLALVEQVLEGHVGQVLHAVSPSVAATVPRERVRALLENILPQMQEALPQIMGDLKKTDKNPYWGFTATLLATGENIHAIVPKDSGQIKTLQDFLLFANVMALVHEPAAVAWLALHGVSIRFVQTATPPPGHRKIIV